MKLLIAILSTLKSLACSAERDSISCRHTACNFTRRRFGLTWNTVPISGQGLPSASSFHLTASSAERFESSTTEFFPIGLTHWHCVEMLHLFAYFSAYTRSGGIIRTNSSRSISPTHIATKLAIPPIPSG
ncbi:unnamed protein product [Parnassius mnemosyne]|uniref:Secreted protein n=1 Tax=Parnassius mnemosyne TaxID=213953 RepID=A0AAV1KWM5_9NEOP